MAEFVCTHCGCTNFLDAAAAAEAAGEQMIYVNDKIPVQWDGTKSTCKYCQCDIGWGKTAKGKNMPFDLDDSHTCHFDTCTGRDQ